MHGWLQSSTINCCNSVQHYTKRLPVDYAEVAVYFGVSFFTVTWPYLFEVNNQGSCRGA